jgi:RNA 2',3'-cyclic 3'-phosphodiesterase
VTKSNDLDPWIGDTPEEKPKAEIQVDAKPDEEVEAEPEAVVVPADSGTTDVDEVSEPVSDADPVSDSDDDAEDANELVDKKTGDGEPSEWTPTDVPERTRSGRDTIELYTARKGAKDVTFIQRSEATYVPSDPKLYVAPIPEDEEETPEFGFPEVPENTQRLFIAIEIPRKLKREFLDLANSFRPREWDRVRWIDEEAMHLTLKFLGDTPADQIPDIKDALQQAAESTGKFTVKIGRTGCFPSFVDPRICWVGFTGELRRLEQLQGRVEGRMVALGLEEDDREFRAHITVGRTRPGIRGRFAEDIGISWQHAPLRLTGQEVSVNAIALYRSYLDDKDDTQYQQLANFELG